jgi:hypothetical protein
LLPKNTLTTGPAETELPMNRLYRSSTLRGMVFTIVRCGLFMSGGAKLRSLQSWAAHLLLLVGCVGCVDVTPPWEKASSAQGGAAGQATRAGAGAGGSPHASINAFTTNGGGSTVNAPRKDSSGGTHAAGTVASSGSSDAGVSGGAGPASSSWPPASSGTGGQTGTQTVADASIASEVPVVCGTLPGTDSAVISPVEVGGVGDAGISAGDDAGYAPNSCTTPVIPANRGINGLVTNFTDWDSANAQWGSPNGLHGKIFEYSGGGATVNKVKVEGSPVGLHLTGSMTAKGFVGVGLTFMDCATLAAFTQVQFDIYGMASGSSLDLQILTYGQATTELISSDECTPDAGATCQQFPTVKGVTDVFNRIGNPRTVTQALGNFSSWWSTNVAQIVGLRWHLTGTAIGHGSKYVDLTITNIRFIP